uniref:Cytochrome b n=2 Tax=Bursaphelenchus xylophilus TaxID=6326 RepID=A0A1I7SP38_BURXY
MVVIGNRLRRRGFYQLYLQVHKVLLYGMLITVF